ATNPSATNFGTSPHGVFRYTTGSSDQVFVLHGQTLTTYTVNATGDLQVAREDLIGSMAARETNGGVAFNNGFLYVSSEAGLEIFDLRNVRAGGGAPLFQSRSLGLHYRRLATSGNLLAALYPETDIPCSLGPSCVNYIDIYNVSDPKNPIRTATIPSNTNILVQNAWNDIAFNNGFLMAAGTIRSVSFSVTPAGSASLAWIVNTPGTYLVSNGTNLLGIGNDGAVTVFQIDTFGDFHPYLYESLDPAFQIDRSNQVVFHPQGSFDDAGSRLIMEVDERDPITTNPARTIGFDVFDFSVPQLNISDPRIWESSSYTTGDEVKWNPVAVGPYVYTIGEVSGLQSWGACGLMTGKIELDNVTELFCGGTEIHGWVTGAQKVSSVEVFLDNASLGPATISTLPRIDVSSRTPVFTWRATVNLDNTAKGDHVMRIVATDALGNRRQVFSQRMYFPGPPSNCTIRRSRAASHG
ncbi:MAG TPA: hypothetical protein VH087_21015, partial [Thermoanaerobaculia bacterium]|nr:hypothetical protein [Thermoanaerobaculia bacterium]